MAIAAEEFARLEQAIRAEWCAETAWAPHTWSEASPARGQCFSTAYVVQSLLGGSIVHAEVLPQRSPREGHSWNRLADGTELDLTLEQFVAGETFKPTEFPEHLVWGAGGKQAELLLERVKAWLTNAAGSTAL